jgi:hypothetical protein
VTGEVDLGELERELNRQFSEFFSKLFTDAVRFRCWQLGSRIYAYTTQRQPDGKFHAYVFRSLKDGTWRALRCVKFARRKVARARAYRWYQRAKEARGK